MHFTRSSIRFAGRLALALPLFFAGCHGKKEEPNATSQPASGANAAPALTEGQIVGALVATTRALTLSDSLAADAIESIGVKSYAIVLRADHRAIGDEIQAVADTIKVGAQTSPIADRLRNEASSIAAVLTDSTVSHTSAFVDAQIEMQKHLIGAMDSAFLPAARTPALRQVLQDLRPAMVAHLQRGEQLKQILVTAAAAASATPRVAARISPDSARKPTDSTAVGGVRVDSGSMRTDTIR
jgi:predicted outer membrane protein